MCCCPEGTSTPRRYWTFLSNVQSHLWQWPFPTTNSLFFCSSSQWRWLHRCPAFIYFLVILNWLLQLPVSGGFGNVLQVERCIYPCKHYALSTSTSLLLPFFSKRSTDLKNTSFFHSASLFFFLSFNPLSLIVTLSFSFSRFLSLFSLSLYPVSLPRFIPCLF